MLQNTSPFTFKRNQSDGYSPYNYKWMKYINRGDYDILKYCTYSKDGNIDYKTELKDYDYEDDAARQALGDKWRIPTYDEWTALRTQCSWTWTYDYKGTNVAGSIVTGKNGNQIFLPAKGCLDGVYIDYKDVGYYWSSNCRNYVASCELFSSSGVESEEVGRDNGLSVRPVYGNDPKGDTSQSFVNYYGYAAHFIKLWGDSMIYNATGSGTSVLKKNWISAVAYLGGTRYELAATDGEAYQTPGNDKQYGKFYWIWTFQNSTVEQALKTASASNPVTITMIAVNGKEYKLVFSEPQKSSSFSHYKYNGQ